MKKVLLVAVILSSLIVTGAFAEQGMNKSMHNGKTAKEVMYHINPMPNYMTVIMRHGDELDLSEKQHADLAKWREQTRPAMSSLKKATLQAENKIRSMSLGNASEEELLVQYAEIEKLLKPDAIEAVDSTADLDSDDQVEKLDGATDDRPKPRGYVGKPQKEVLSFYDRKTDRMIKVITRACSLSDEQVAILKVAAIGSGQYIHKKREECGTAKQDAAQFNKDKIALPVPKTHPIWKTTVE